ncbi:MAG: S9 family peptidase [Candidatus Marinimicrobia bacterium]|jgi:oligopeptidase B|nr:S9 family peptidase [Candidatus Neomarinimicrobiota bacterium]
MKRTMQFFIGLLGLLFIVTSCEKIKESKMIPSKAKKIKKELTIHNDTRIDNYYWLRDREDPKVIKYLENENEYSDAVMKDTKKLQTKLYDEMVNRIKQEDESVPYKFNGYYYYTRFEKGNEHPIYCRKKGSLESKEEILLNENEMAKGFSYFHIADFSVSPDNKIIAYSVDTLSRRKYTIKFINLETGELLKDNIPNTSGNIVWANDNKTIFYNVKDESLRPYKTVKHILRTDVKNDKTVYEEKDNTFYHTVSKSKSQKYILFCSESTLSTEYHILDANTPNGKLKIIQPRQKDLEYDVDHIGKYFYIRTNKDAKNFKIVKTEIEHLSQEYWVDVIPAREDILISDFEIFNNYLVVKEFKNALPFIKILDFINDKKYTIDIKEPAYTLWISTNLEGDSDILRYGYESMTTPSSIYDFNMVTKKKKLMKEEEVLGDFDKNNYQTERLFATARDCTKVPISIVYRKGLKKNGKAPLLIYGYGSYGNNMPAYFSTVRLSLLDRGFVYAITHIRGGQEMGRKWYEDGKLLKKKNTFYDFIDCTKYLVKEKYASPEKVFARGGSAGGLLMGAISNMAPDLYTGIIAQVPFVDVVTTMLDESIPLTTGEYDEWGNPNVKKYYDYMLSYSPYDNVEAKEYPNMLITTGLHDSQVQYWEPAKWVAKLRDLKTDDNLLLIHINMDFGHGGASGRFEVYKEYALEYAFIFKILNIKK